MNGGMRKPAKSLAEEERFFNNVKTSISEEFLGLKTSFNSSFAVLFLFTKCLLPLLSSSFLFFRVLFVILSSHESLIAILNESTLLDITARICILCFLRLAIMLCAIVYTCTQIFAEKIENVKANPFKLQVGFVGYKEKEQLLN